MNDDQMITLLREAPLPPDDPARYDAVVERGRRQDRRRTAVAAACLAVVAIAGTVTAVTWPGHTTPGAQSFLKATQAAGTAHVVGVETSEGHTARFEGDINFGTGRMALSQTSDGLTLEVRFIDHAIFMRQAPQALPGGKHWIRYDSETTEGKSLKAIDPGIVLDTLRSEHATLTKVGRKQINGTETDEYVVSGLAGDDYDLFKYGPGHLFVGDDGLVRRISSSKDGDSQVIDFSDYGRQVDISVPPASDTADPKELGFDQLSGSASGTVQITPGPQDAAAKARTCQLAKDALAKQTQMTQAQKARVLQGFCG